LSETARGSVRANVVKERVMAKDERELTAAGLIFYQTEDGLTRVQIRLHEGTVWLTQKQLAELYQVTVSAVSQHLRGIFEDGELAPEATVKRFLIVRTEGNRSISRKVDHYSLPVVLAIGYRVRSLRGTQFRQWATTRLTEYLVKGFTIDDERLENPPGPGTPDYFDELLERIRRIRASERRFYQKLTDVYARCSVDYDPSADVTRTFYATVQNKMHWAIHGHTAAEVVRARANASQPHMGLTNWKSGPSGPIRKVDVTIAKNYLSAEELSALDRVVVMYLDYAEEQARKRRPMTMADWATKLDGFLAFNEHNVLTHAGTVSQALAAAHAEAEFDRYDAEQLRLEATNPSSDFDHLVEAGEKLVTAAPKKAARGKKP
jgi:hypothetical protein